MRSADHRLIAQFKTFHAENPNVYHLFERFAYDAIRAQHVNFSADMVLHRVRWETSIRTEGDNYKINNNFSAFYARLFMHDHPTHNGFFRCRSSAADGYLPDSPIVSTHSVPQASDTPAATEEVSNPLESFEEMPTSPEAIKRFLLFKPLLPPIDFRGADEDVLLDLIYGIGDHELLVKTLPRKNQLEGLAFSLWAQRALLFFEMRTGKTKIAFDFISHLLYSELIHRPALIIGHAPIGVDEWENQIPLHSHLVVRIIRSGPDSYERFVDAAHNKTTDAVLVSWSTLQQMFTVKRVATTGRNKGKEKLYVDRPKCRAVAGYFGAAVIDEIHMAGHHDTLRFGIASELVQHCDWRLGLTGTPFGRDPFLLWAQAYLMDSGEALGRSFYFFREAFGKPKFNPFSRVNEYVFDQKKLPLLKEKMAAMTLTCELREIQDVNVLSGVVKLSMSREQRTAYNEVIDKLVQLRIGNTVEIDNTFVRLRQVASGWLPFTNDAGEDRIVDFPDASKFTWLEDFLPELPPDLKCVIFHEFIHTGARICVILNKLKMKYEWLHGGAKDRQNLLARFQTGDSQVLVANAATGGMSINLSAANYLCFFESPASVIARKQAEARPLSRGDRPLVIDDLVCAPIEEKILDFVREGNSLRDALLKDPKGLAAQLRM